MRDIRRAQDFSFEGQKWIANWSFKRVNIINPHLSLYSSAGSGKGISRRIFLPAALVGI